MKIEEIPIDSWDEFTTLMITKPYKGNIYRGHEDASWELETKLQRAFRDLRIAPRYQQGREDSIVSTFKRKAHPYLRHLPNDRNKNREYLEWLSIMQHYGAPTRLLDWTYSPFIAAFFAIENMNESACVFEMDYKRIRKANIEYDGKNHFDKCFDKSYKSVIVLPYEPKMQNERLVAQQGLFIYPNRINENIEEIMKYE